MTLNRILALGLFTAFAIDLGAAIIFDQPILAFTAFVLLIAAAAVE